MTHEDLEVADGADAPALTALLNEAYRPVESFFHRGPRTTIEVVRERIGRGFFLARRAGDAIGACVYVEPRGESAYLGMLAVAPGGQRGGTGAALVAGAERFLAARGVRRVELDVISLRADALRPFYERLGYRVCGQRPFEDPLLTRPCDLVLMEKTIG
ncbi:MAG: GNAT family N-acetyltransferase [Vicinamibacteria bacterium]